MNSLCIDARWLYTGIGVYTLNLVRELSNRSELELHALTYSQHEAVLHRYCNSLSIVNAPIYSISEQFAVTRATRPFPVLHVPHYNAPLMREGTVLITIHDLTHILDARFRNSPKSLLYARPMLRLAARKAAHIFTVSEYSRQQIVEHLNVPSEKVSVTYNGVGPAFFPESREKARQTVQRECGVARPYILYVGNLKPHKNVGALLRAFALAWRRTAGAIDLLIIGDDASGGPALKNLAANLGIAAATKFAGRVSDELLRCTYSAAELTVLPSLEEGFGLPVLESMACGTPVACSRVASLPEVAGNAAEYFDPHDIESIAETIERLLHSDGNRARLRELGISNAKRFTWPACADRHMAIYRRYCLSRN